MLRVFQMGGFSLMESCSVPCPETHGSDCAEAGDGPQPQHSRLRLLNISHHSVAGLLSSLPEHHLLIFPVLGVVKGGDVRESCQKINMDRLGWAHIVDEWLDDWWGHVGEGVVWCWFFEMSSDGDVEERIMKVIPDVSAPAGRHN